MRTLARLGPTLGALTVGGLFIALISADVYVAAYNELGVPGKYAVQFALAFALIIGWALA